VNTQLEQCINAFGTFQLQRLPLQKGQSLRAWDAADEYLLKHCAANQLLKSDSKVLIINDQFGALNTSLNQYATQSWSDSYINELSSLHNLRINHLDQTLQVVPSTEEPQGIFDLVLIKIPKTMALLEEQLIRLKPHITADTVIISAAMVRNIHNSTLELFERILGTTHTSLAQKKARLVFTKYEKTDAIKPPFPNNIHIKSLGIYLSNHANVFSKNKLDYASLLLLEQFKLLPPSKHIVDLGCGNGILGLIAQKHQPESQISFLDESYMAIASAQMNYTNLYKEKTYARFIISDGLSELPKSDELDLVLCNPPFHQQHSIGDQIAWRMFTHSWQRLKQDGELWIVGNQHLKYSAKLKKIFGNSRIVASNEKFQVIAATKK